VFIEFVRRCGYEFSNRTVIVASLIAVAGLCSDEQITNRVTDGGDATPEEIKSGNYTTAEIKLYLQRKKERRDVQLTTQLGGRGTSSAALISKQISAEGYL
jgi:hypothetical protein